MASSWDARSYKSYAEAREAQAEAQQRAEQRAGIAQFNPDQLTRTLHSAFFHRFCLLLVRVEEWPSKLAAFGEGCACHSALVRRASPHMVGKMFELHYGARVTACPCAGMMALELVRGVLDHCAQELWRDVEHDLMTCPVPDVCASMTMEEWGRLTANLHSAQAHMSSILRMKTSYWQKLPWLLCGLAIGEDSMSRKIGQRCLDQFDQDPRQEAHHRLTWSLLNPDSWFRAELLLYVLGASLLSMSAAFRTEVAKRRFVFVSETSVESKHAHVAIAKGRHAIGPCKVSLSSRLRMMEELLVRRQLDVQQLVHNFAECRSLPRVAALFGLRRHPKLCPPTQAGSKKLNWHTTIMEIVYNCELGGMYRSMRKYIEDHNTQSRREAVAAKRVTTPQQEVLTFPMVEQRLMQQHMAKVMRTGVVYSCPKSVVRLDSLSDVLDEPATKRARTEVGSAPWLQSSVDAAGEEQAATGLGTLLFFRLAFANAGKKKQMRIPVGVGGRVKQGDVMVTVHDAIAGASESPIVSSRLAGAISGPTFVLQDWSLGALPEIKTLLVEYASSETRWCFRDRVSKRVSPATTRDILTCMVTVGPVVECLPSEGLAIDASDIVVRRAVQELIDENIVEEMQQGRLRFTRHGQAQVSTCNALAGPSCVFAPPSHAMDLTKLASYQLVQKLLEDGWEWRLWVAPGRRPKSMRIPPGYKIGEPKLWFSTRDVPRHYLLALLQASSLADRGLTCIPHGQDESYYKDLLDADRPFQGASPHPPLEVPAALLDIDMAGSEDEGVACRWGSCWRCAWRRTHARIRRGVRDARLGAGARGAPRRAAPGPGPRTFASNAGGRSTGPCAPHTIGPCPACRSSGGGQHGASASAANARRTSEAAEASSGFRRPTGEQLDWRLPVHRSHARHRERPRRLLRALHLAPTQRQD